MADTNSLVMMALGDFRFGLNTAAYEELERRTNWRWPEVERIGALPALQFTGPGQDTVNLSGVIFPQFRGGLGQMDTMRAEANKGLPLNMVDGTGRVWGLWCIIDIGETRRVLFSDGTPRQIEFFISLSNYGANQ